MSSLVLIDVSLFFKGAPKTFILIEDPDDEKTSKVSSPVPRKQWK